MKVLSKQSGYTEITMRELMEVVTHNTKTCDWGAISTIHKNSVLHINCKYLQENLCIENTGTFNFIVSLLHLILYFL